MKKAIILVSFGVVDEVVRSSCLDSIALKIKQSFPDYTVCTAFTSMFILKQLRKQNIHIDSLPEVLLKLQQEQYEEVVIQPTHLTPGEEYENKIIAVGKEYKTIFPQLKIGRPVFFVENETPDEDDYIIGLKCILQQIISLAQTEEVVLMGHGSPHQHNPIYEVLQRKADELKLPITIGVLEPTDYPGFDDVVVRLKNKNKKNIYLMPLLLAGGMHVMQDMAGDSPDSWLNKLQNAGFIVRVYAKGLGENEAFQNIYVQHIQDALQTNTK
jgi:sirohydrochlorin cobaltochelatase